MWPIFTTLVFGATIVAALIDSFVAQEVQGAQRAPMRENPPSDALVGVAGSVASGTDEADRRSRKDRTDRG